MEGEQPDDAWFRSAVVYQIYPRSFADSDGDGIGDLAGITTKIDYLAGLGVDVLWLSPIYPSPQDDNGYDISDYRNVDPLFGSLEAFDLLMAEVHSHGMKLVMDLVVNHTSDEHPWFLESLSGTTNTKRNWYWWRPPRDGMTAGTPGAEPTNWESSFSGSAWQFDEASGQYYLHLFSRKQPDLNWENEEVRAAVFEMMRWWLDRGVDGFRMDVINFISKVLPLSDGLTSGGQIGAEKYLNGPRIHEFLREMTERVFADRPGQWLTVGEMPGVTVDEARLFTDPARREVDMVFQFEHVSLDQIDSKWRPRPLRLTSLKASLGRWQSGLAEIGWNSLYWNNHDQPRAVSRFGDDGRYRVVSAKALATVLHLHRGTPYIYQGEEIGMTNYPFAAVEEFQDIESLNHYRAAVEAGEDAVRVLATLRGRSRDNARTPMQWSNAPHAGFTTGTPWMAANPNYPGVNVDADMADPASVYWHYRRLIALRHTEPVVANGDFTMLMPDDEQIYAFTRKLKDVQLLVVANMSGAPAEPGEFGEWATAQPLIGTTAGDPSRTLQPWEYRVLRRRVRPVTESG